MKYAHIGEYRQTVSRNMLSSRPLFRSIVAQWPSVLWWKIRVSRLARFCCHATSALVSEAKSASRILVFRIQNRSRRGGRAGGRNLSSSGGVQRRRPSSQWDDVRRKKNKKKKQYETVGSENETYARSVCACVGGRDGAVCLMIFSFRFVPATRGGDDDTHTHTHGERR